MEIKVASPSMFPAIQEVLREFGGQLRTEDWRELLDYRFSDHDRRGWVSVKNGEIVGYLGAIYSERNKARFCSLTSWIVKKAHRNGDLRILEPMLELTDHTVLNFSPSRFTHALFSRLGFDVLDEEVVLIPPLTPRLLPRGYEIVRKRDDMAAILTPGDVRIWRDHERYHLRHVVINGPHGYCYVVASKTRLRRWPVSFIHHISHPEIFRLGVNLVQRELLRAHRTPLTVVDARLVEGHPIRGAVRYRLSQPRLFRPANDVAVQRSSIDSLYTELVVLNPTRWTFNF